MRVGHAGTLDPFATGVLLVMVGDATRLMPLVSRLKKHYLADTRLGVQTETLDPEGAVVQRQDPGPYNPSALNEALFEFRGEVDQIPPRYSALKVGGKRAYRLARAGQDVELESRKVWIHHLGIAQVRWPSVHLHVACGPGTYIRSLARDLGLAMGLPAMLEGLRRVRIGPFDVSRALCLEEGLEYDEVEKALRDALIPSEELAFASGVPTLTLDLVEARRFVMGQRLRIEASRIPSQDEEPLAIFYEEPETNSLRMVGLGRWKEAEVLSPYKVFSAVGEHLINASQ